MTTEKFDLVFSGELLPHQEPEQVKARFAALFKMDPAQVARLFSGKTLVLKRDLDLDTANRYRMAIKQAGARVALRKSESADAVVVAQPPAPQNLAAQPVDAPMPTVAPMRAAWSLAPVGADLLAESEKRVWAPREADLRHLTLRDQSGPLVDEAERARPAVRKVADLAAVLLPVGAQLLEQNERVKVVAAPVADLDAHLAPPGARLSEPTQERAKAPNTDHIQLLPS